MTYERFAELNRQWWTDKELRKTQRFGQFVCNQENITDSVVFNEPNYALAHNLILRDHVHSDHCPANKGGTCECITGAV